MVVCPTRYFPLHDILGTHIEANNLLGSNVSVEILAEYRKKYDQQDTPEETGDRDTPGTHTI